jgi:hypothetical protein
MHLLKGLGVHPAGRGKLLRFPALPGRFTNLAEVVKGFQPEGDKVSVDKVAGGGDNQAVGGIVLLNIIQEFLRIHGRNHFMAAENGSAKWVAPPEKGGEKVMDMVVWNVFDHVYFLEDHLAFPLYLLVCKERVGQQVGQQFHQDRKFAVHDRGMQTGVFPRGEGVGGAAEDIELPGNVPGRTAGRPLEEHMLDKVGRTAVQVMFIAGAGINPHPDRNHLGVRIRFRDDPDAVGEECPVNHGIKKG